MFVFTLFINSHSGLFYKTWVLEYNRDCVAFVNQRWRFRIRKLILKISLQIALESVATNIFLAFWSALI